MKTAKVRGSGRQLTVAQEEDPLVKSKASRTPSRRWKALAFALPMALAASLAAHGSEMSRTFDQTYPFQASQTVTVSNVNGRIQVASWDRQEVRVQAVIHAKGLSEDRVQEALKAISVEVTPSAEGLVVETRYPHHHDGFFAWLTGQHVSAEVDYQLTVPKQTSLSAETVNGSVHLDKVDGKLKLSSTNGSIHVDGADGALIANTTNGSVKIRNSAGSVRAETTNGAIEVELTSVAPKANLHLETVNGHIALTLPSTLGADIHAETVNGSIRSDLPVTVQGKLNRREFNGKLNGGGALVHLETVNGSIHLLRLGAAAGN